MMERSLSAPHHLFPFLFPPKARLAGVTISRGEGREGERGEGGYCCSRSRPIHPSPSASKRRCLSTLSRLFVSGLSVTVRFTIPSSHIPFSSFPSPFFSSPTSLLSSL